MNEKELINLLNSGDEYNFVAMDDKFSRYDAFDTENGIMLEIKCRNKHYDDTLLERRKFDWNKKYALDNDLEFMYAVSIPVPEACPVILTLAILYSFILLPK